MLRAEVRAAFLPSARDRNCCHLRAEGVSGAAQLPRPIQYLWQPPSASLSGTFYHLLLPLREAAPHPYPLDAPCLLPVQAPASSDDLTPLSSPPPPTYSKGLSLLLFSLHSSPHGTSPGAILSAASSSPHLWLSCFWVLIMLPFPGGLAFSNCSAMSFTAVIRAARAFISGSRVSNLMGWKSWV